MAVNWARKNSILADELWTGMCCAIEMMLSMIASRHDISRFGAEVMRGSPRQSDFNDHRGARLEQDGSGDPAVSMSRCRNPSG